MKKRNMLAAAGLSIVVMAVPALAQAPADAKTPQASSTTKTSWNGLPERVPG